MVCSLLMKLLLPHVFFAPFLVRANFISQNPSPRTAAWCSPRYMACAWGLHASPEHETSNSMLLLRAVSRGLELAPRKTSNTQVPLSQHPRFHSPKFRLLLWVGLCWNVCVWFSPSIPLVKIPLSLTAVCQEKTWILCNNRRLPRLFFHAQLIRSLFQAKAADYVKIYTDFVIYIVFQRMKWDHQSQSICDLT